MQTHAEAAEPKRCECPISGSVADKHSLGGCTINMLRRIAVGGGISVRRLTVSVLKNWLK